MRRQTIGTILVAVCLIIFVLAWLWVVSRTAPTPERTLARAAIQVTDTASVIAASVTKEKTLEPTQVPATVTFIAVQAATRTVDCWRATPISLPGQPPMCLLSQELELKRQEDRLNQTAAAAIPTDDPNVTPTEAPPTITPSPYVLTDADRVARRIPFTIPAQGEHRSMWDIGLVVDSRGIPYGQRLWIDIIPDHQGQMFSILVLEYTILNLDATSDPGFENKRWWMPRFIGRPTITAVSADRRIVSFVGEHGETGTFDLVTATWSFSDTVTPLPTRITPTPYPTATPMSQ